jgi:hypothetical protein
MTNLEAKILGEDIRDNYCSSSEDESGEAAVFHDAPDSASSNSRMPSQGTVNVSSEICGIFGNILN